MRIVDWKEADRILLIDFSNLAYISHFGMGPSMMTSNGYPTGHVYGFFERLLDLTQRNNEIEDLGIVLAFDNNAKHKKILLPSYKANRKEQEFDPRPDIKKMARYFKCAFIECADQEADDAIATFCEQNYKREVVIDVVSSDKDLYQLKEQYNVRIFNPMKQSYVGLDDRYNSFGVNTWDKVVLWKALFGDSSDNIKAGLPRVKKLLVLPIINESNGTVKDFYKLYEDKYKDDFTVKSQEKFTMHKKDIETNLKVVKLDRNLPIEIENHNGNDRFLNGYLKMMECDSLMLNASILTGKGGYIDA